MPAQHDTPERHFEEVGDAADELRTAVLELAEAERAVEEARRDAQAKLEGLLRACKRSGATGLDLTAALAAISA